MALKSLVFNVTTAAMQLAEEGASNSDERTVMVRAMTGDIYVGGADVTTANGMPVLNGEVLTWSLEPGDDLYAIAAGTVAVRVTVNRS